MRSQKFSKRAFLKLSVAGATACALNVPSMSFAAADESAKRLPERTRKIPVALQLYTVRNECAQDLDGTIAAIGKMGYAAVEFADYFGRSAKQLRKLLDDAGLKCCGTHIYINTMMGDELARTIEFNQILGNRFLIVRSMPEKYSRTHQGWLDAAAAMDEIAGKLGPFGMRVGFHNHNTEFKLLGGEPPEDTLFGHTRKEVFIQFDTCNAMEGGGEAVVYLKRFPGRVASMHVKPFSNARPNALLGDDELPWAEIFHLCETIGGTEWYVIEYEKDLYPPMVVAQKTIEIMRRWGKC